MAGAGVGTPQALLDDETRATAEDIIQKYTGAQEKTPSVITRTYGPTVLADTSVVARQLLGNAVVQRSIALSVADTFRLTFLRLFEPLYEAILTRGDLSGSTMQLTLAGFEVASKMQATRHLTLPLTTALRSLAEVDETRLNEVVRKMNPCTNSVVPLPGEKRGRRADDGEANEARLVFACVFADISTTHAPLFGSAVVADQGAGVGAGPGVDAAADQVHAFLENFYIPDAYLSGYTFARVAEYAIGSYFPKQLEMPRKLLEERINALVNALCGAKELRAAYHKHSIRKALRPLKDALKYDKLGSGSPLWKSPPTAICTTPCECTHPLCLAHHLRCLLRLLCPTGEKAFAYGDLRTELAEIQEEHRQAELAAAAEDENAAAPGQKRKRKHSRAANKRSRNVQGTARAQRKVAGKRKRANIKTQHQRKKKKKKQGKRRSIINSARSQAAAKDTRFLPLLVFVTRLSRDLRSVRFAFLDGDLNADRAAAQDPLFSLYWWGRHVARDLLSGAKKKEQEEEQEDDDDQEQEEEATDDSLKAAAVQEAVGRRRFSREGEASAFVHLRQKRLPPARVDGTILAAFRGERLVGNKSFVQEVARRSPFKSSRKMHVLQPLFGLHQHTADTGFGTRFSGTTFECPPRLRGKDPDTFKGTFVLAHSDAHCGPYARLREDTQVNDLVIPAQALLRNVVNDGKRVVGDIKLAEDDMVQVDLAASLVHMIPEYVCATSFESDGVGRVVLAMRQTYEASRELASGGRFTKNRPGPQSAWTYGEGTPDAGDLDDLAVALKDADIPAAAIPSLIPYVFATDPGVDPTVCGVVKAVHADGSPHRELRPLQEKDKSAIKQRRRNKRKRARNRRRRRHRGGNGRSKGRGGAHRKRKKKQRKRQDRRGHARSGNKAPARDAHKIPRYSAVRQTAAWAANITQRDAFTRHDLLSVQAAVWVEDGDSDDDLSRTARQQKRDAWQELRATANLDDPPTLPPDRNAPPSVADAQTLLSLLLTAYPRNSCVYETALFSHRIDVLGRILLANPLDHARVAHLLGTGDISDVDAVACPLWSPPKKYRRENRQDFLLPNKDGSITESSPLMPSTFPRLALPGFGYACPSWAYKARLRLRRRQELDRQIVEHIRVGIASRGADPMTTLIVEGSWSQTRNFKANVSNIRASRRGKLLRRAGHRYITGDEYRSTVLSSRTLQPLFLDVQLNGQRKHRLARLDPAEPRQYKPLKKKKKDEFELLLDKSDPLLLTMTQGSEGGVPTLDRYGQPLQPKNQFAHRDVDAACVQGDVSCIKLTYNDLQDHLDPLKTGSDAAKARATAAAETRAKAGNRA